jgi:hypothetical protein
VALFFGLGLKNLEDEVLLAQTAGSGNVEAAGQLGQLGDIVIFKFGYCHDLPEIYLIFRGDLELRRGVAGRETLDRACFGERGVVRCAAAAYGMK